MHRLRLGFSPCPNDTFVFHALVHGAVPVPFQLDVHLEDVETLNRWAARGRLDVAKVSYHAFGHLADDWWLLPAGGALSHGIGPLLIARDPELELAGRTVATPGGRTTANLLLDLYAPAATRRIEMRYDHIMPAVASGTVDAGLIIHESRFTYPDHGLHALADLGAWWDRTTRTPVPLGGIAVRRDLADDVVQAVADGVADSVRAAFADPGASAAYVARHAQEMSAEVRDRHIRTYVNAFTRDVGEEGRRGVRTLFARACEQGLMPPVRSDLFWDGR